MATKKKKATKAKKKTTTSEKEKVVKKAPRKTTASKKANVIGIPEIIEEEVIIESPADDTEDTSTSPFNFDQSASSQIPQKGFKKSQIIGLGVIVIIIILLYVFRSQFIVATVNGQLISRTAYNTELEKEAGSKSMDALVTKMLILQEADKEHVTVSQKEIDDQINTIKQQLSKQGETLDQALKSQNLTMQDLEEQIKISQLIQKMLAKNTTVTDKEVDDYIAKSAQQASQDQTNNPDVTPTPTPSRAQVKNMLQQEKLNQQFQPWLANLKQKAKINYFISYSGQ